MKLPDDTHLTGEETDDAESLLDEVLEFIEMLDTDELCLQCRSSSAVQPHSRNCKELLRLKVKHRIASEEERKLADALRIGETK